MKYFFFLTLVALCLAVTQVSTVSSHPTQDSKQDEKTAKPESGDDLKAAAFIVSGSIVVFTPNVGLQGREDVVNATLFAQLAGNAQFNRDQMPSKWYSFYLKVLNNIAFVVTSSTGFQQVKTPTFTMESVVVDTIKTTTSPTGLNIAKSAIDALGKLPANDRAVVLFQSNTTASSIFGNFQVIVCDEVDGEPSVTFGLFYFHGPKYDPRFLWDTVSSKDVTMFAGVNKYELNEAIYAGVRDDIAKRLGDRLHTMVAQIGI